MYKISGKRNNLTNYQPMSIIHILAKLFERVVYDQQYHYLTDIHILLYGFQSGFHS